MPEEIHAGGKSHPLHYVQAGQGATLLLIHGSLCDYRYWRWQIPALSLSCRVIAPSLRGFWPEAFITENDSFSIAQHVSDLQALIRETSPGQPVHILGHSRGAQVALQLALSAPELARSLILADPGFRIDNEPEAAAFHTRVVAQLKRGEVDEALADFIDSVNGPDTWRQMVGWFKAMVNDNAYTLLSQVHETNLPVSLDSAASLRCPVLLVGGANSQARFGSRLDILEQAIAQAERVTIPLASHGMNLGNPKAFNQTVADFLNQIDS
ncbi:alpha/beta hydrolase [Alcaligenaceae bacterium]|nr:alpha/beta hydrolase [Alcaligenaceae bacterium]